MATQQVPTSYKDPFWSDLAANTEQKLGLPSGLLVSVLTRGERSNADQVSEAGARTPFQIIPATRKAVLDKYGIDAYLNPQTAAEAAGLLLKESLDRNQGNILLAAAEYHGGTDPKNWGPRTKAYMQRVSQGVRELTTQAAPAAGRPVTIAEGGTTSTFQRALAASPMAGVPQDAIARVFEAYSSGQMTPAEAAEFEADVKAGNIMLPRGAALRGQQPQGARPTIPELPAPVLEAYRTGRMTRDEMMELERDVANGMARVPTGFQLQKTEPMGVLGGIREAVTGTERTTPTTQALPDWASMPELNTFSMASFKSALGTMMTSPQETVQIIQSNFPGVKVSQDEKGNFVLQSSIDGQMYAIKPGFQLSDIPRAAGAIAAFTPAGRATTIPGAIAGGAATQAAIEASQTGIPGVFGGALDVGGRFDTGEVALAGALGGAGQAVTRIPQMVRAVRGGEAPPVAPAAGEQVAAPITPPTGTVREISPTGAVGPEVPLAAPAAPAGAPMSTAMAPAAPAAPAAAAAAPMTTSELAQTARTATGGGMGAGRATEVLATQAAPDPKVLEAARRLKIEGYLQPDHLTSNQAYRELAQAVKSIPGSQARAAELTGLEAVGKQADDLITQIGGMTDLSRMNQAVRTNLSQTVANLERRANTAYDDLRQNIPAQTRGPADNVLAFVEQRALDLDGPKNLSPLEKAVRSKLSPKEIKDADGNVIGMRQPTYALIDDVRRDIGAAARQQGAFKDADTGLAKRLYALIDDDQFALAEAAGRGEQYRLAKSLVSMRKGFEDDMVSLFGRELDQSLVTKLSTATTSLSKGDADKLVKVLQAIPEDMRRMVAASALNTAFGKATQNGALNFNTYANWYEGLLQNKQAYAALMNNLPQPARKALSDLYRVSNNVRKATRERITTGRIQAVQQELQNTDSLLSNVFNVAKRAAIGIPAEAATTAVGLPGAGIASGLTAALSKGVKPEVLKAADELISSPEFQRLAVEGATKTNPSQATIRSVALSAAFRRFADAAKMPRELSWRERWLVQSMQAAGQFDQENQR